jgi:ferrous-iron efflux pump FieF
MRLTSLRAAQASVATATLLSIAKLYAALVTGSVAMLGSLADSALDLIASLSLLYGIQVAAEPPDRDHRFGHGKAEAVAALFQVMLIGVSALGITIQAIRQIASGSGTASAGAGIAVSLLAIAVTFLLVIYQRRVIAASNSLAIKTDSLHYRGDLALNLAVITALALNQYAGIHGADALFGLAIAAWLGWSAWSASTKAIDQLMDREWPEAKRQRFLAVASQHPELRGIHELRTRTSGNRDFVQFHVWVDPQMTLVAAHRVMDEVEARLMREFPDTEVLIHPDPEGHLEPTDRVQP